MEIFVFPPSFGSLSSMYALEFGHDVVSVLLSCLSNCPGNKEATPIWKGMQEEVGGGEEISEQLSAARHRS